MPRSFFKPKSNHNWSPQVKFCGITNLSDARDALSLGVDYLGLIFVKNTKRYLDLNQAKTLIESLKTQESKLPKLVGVFQNESVDLIRQAIELLALDFIQCHGNESMETIQQLPIPCIKVLTLDTDLTLAELNSISKPYAESHQIPFFILDLPKEDISPESLQKRLKKIAGTHQALQDALHHKPYFLAGKLTPDDLPGILSQWQPYGLDIASGIEQSPGKKDAQKMKHFMETVQHVSDTL